jgi:hypothetical protein
MNETILVFILYITLLIICVKGYYIFYPSLAAHFPDSKIEIEKVINEKKSMTSNDKEFFYSTDKSISKVFEDYCVKNNLSFTLKEITKMYELDTIKIMFMKVLYNRIRPEYLVKDIALHSNNDTGPSFPSKNAYQAYLVAKKISDKHPEHKNNLIEIAKKCDNIRVKAGLSFPSDGEYSYNLIFEPEKYGVSLFIRILDFFRIFDVLRFILL